MSQPINQIQRRAENALKRLSKGFPVVALTGPRQSGKTTLACNIFPKNLTELLKILKLASLHYLIRVHFLHNFQRAQYLMKYSELLSFSPIYKVLWMVNSKWVCSSSQGRSNSDY